MVNNIQLTWKLAWLSIKWNIKIVGIVDFPFNLEEIILFIFLQILKLVEWHSIKQNKTQAVSQIYY